MGLRLELSKERASARVAQSPAFQQALRADATQFEMATLEAISDREERPAVQHHWRMAAPHFDGTEAFVGWPTNSPPSDGTLRDESTLSPSPTQDKKSRRRTRTEAPLELFSSHTSSPGFPPRNSGKLSTRPEFNEIKYMRTSGNRRLCRSCQTAIAVFTECGGTVRSSAVIFLETERLLFRSHEAKDEADFVRMHSDPEVRRFMGGHGWPLEKAQDRFRNQYLGRPSRTYGLWATILKQEAKYIGCCGLRTARGEKSAYLGYSIAQPYWRRGFASEAANAFIDVAFTRLRLPRLLADVEQGHSVSEHILKKFGFNYLRREEIPGSGRVILFYELAKAEWARRTP